MKIHIRMTVTESGFFEVDIQHIRSMHEIIDLSKNNIRSVPLKAFGSLEWSARGGRGGDGGIGGKGGNGASGRPGRDATRYSSGTNGGPGGNGGRGGEGTHGANGARGGDVEIFMDREDSYLLMRIDGCHPVHGIGSRANGGQGGAAGVHGRGGYGGCGGRGGSSYSWTTTHTVTRHSNGRSYNDTETRYHSNPGGWSGSSGSPGFTPQSVLQRGLDGASGTFRIKVKQPNGKEVCYSSRYNVEFDSVVTKHVSDMINTKTYEFGERVFVTRIKVRNTGKMETPKQRVLFRFGNVDGVSCDMNGIMFLKEGSYVPPGNCDCADQGFLQFDCPYPSIVEDVETGVMKNVSNVTDFDPIRKVGSFMYRVYQLGHENNVEELGQISDFQARYTDFQQNRDLIDIVYPVENYDGVRGFRSLAPLETSILELTLHNQSQQEFGKLSKTERSLIVQIYYGDDAKYEIPIEKITVRGEDGKIVDVNNNLTSQGRGYRYDIRSLPARSEYTVQLSFKLDDARIQVSEKAALQLDLYLQKIPRLLITGESDILSKKILIQRRIFVASCQPRFNPKAACDVILVTTTTTNADQVVAWKKILTELGLTLHPYSLSRYGHTNPNEIVEQCKLRNAFQNKLVVFLNEKYTPKPNSKVERLHKCRPSQLLKSAYDYSDSTQFLVVGGSTESVSHLAPASVTLNTNDTYNGTHANMKTYKENVSKSLLSQRSTGFSLKREKLESFDICIKKKSLTDPTNQSIAKIMNTRAKKLARWLEKRDPLRPYNIEWSPLSQSVKSGDKLMSPREIGSLHVSVGPPCHRSLLSFVEEERGSASDLALPATIDSCAMKYATLHAASFEVRMRCYCEKLLLLSQKYPDHEIQNKQAIMIVKDCLVGDLVVDITNYHHCRMKVKNCIDRSPTIQMLRYSVSLNLLLKQALSNENLSNTMTIHISFLMAAMQCVAVSKDLRPWWKPISRKHVASKHIVQALDELDKHWEHVIDKELVLKERKQLYMDVKQAVKDRKKKRFAMLGIRGRWRAAMAELHSPRNSTTYQYSFRSVRVRREAELLSGTTQKIKKFRPRTLNPTESHDDHTASQTDATYRKSIHEVTASEYELYVETDEAKIEQEEVHEEEIVMERYEL